MSLMKRRNLLLASLLVIVLLGSIGIYASAPVKEKHFENGKIDVIVTIPPQAEFVEKIGGDKVEVTIMVPSGASPHTYEPKPSQLKKVAEAEIYAKVGSGVEFELVWMDKIISQNKNMLIIDCSERIELLGKSEQDAHEQVDREGYDPHIWLSLRNAKIMVENIYDGLVKVDPANQDYYAKNKEEYLKELDELDKEITQALSGKTSSKFMVYHPAWTYFARDYNLEQIPIEEEGKEPTPQGIANLIDQARKNNVTIIFASPGFNTKSAQVIAEEISGEVILINPLEKNYLENMRKAAEALGKTLGG